MNKSVEKQQEDSIDDSQTVDTEDVLYRNRQKDKMENHKWTQGILEDVKVFRSFVYRKKKDNRESNKYYAIEAYTADKEPEEAFKESEYKEDSDIFVRSEWRKNASFSCDGTFRHNGDVYEYKENIQPVAVVSSSKENGYKKHVRVRKLSEKPMETFNSLSDKVGRTILIGNSRLGGIQLRFGNKEKKGDAVTFTSRTKYFSGGFLATFVGGLYLSSLVASGFTSIFPMGIAIVTVSVILGFVGTVKLSYSQTPSLYDGKDPDWLYDLPDNAYLREMKEEGLVYTDFESRSMDVNTYEDGTTVISCDSSEWIFNGEKDGTPSPEVENLFDNYGLDIVDNTKEFMVANSSDVIIPSGYTYYESEGEEFILMTKEEFRKMKRNN